MFEHKRKAVAAFAMAASFMMVLCAFAAAAPGSNATGADLDETTYGKVSEINIAPGYQWSYTTTFPDDLEAGTTLSFAKEGDTTLNEMGTNATTEGHTLIVKIPNDQTPGRYNIVLKAEHSASGQTAYQWIRLNVGVAMTTDYSEHITEIIKATSKEFKLSAETTVEGTIEWVMNTSSPGFELVKNDTAWIVTGAPTVVGPNTINLTAKLMIPDGDGTKVGETKDLKIEFTVYNEIKVGDDDEINAIGGVGNEKTELLAGVTQDEGPDLNVTWNHTGSLPAGLGFNESTGAITGSYTGATYGSETFTLTVTSTHPAGTGQSASKQITINYEPAFTLNDVAKFGTYTGNSATVTSDAMVPSTDQHSKITYTIKSPITGISIDSSTGALSITDSAAVTAAGTVTVVATTAYGQIVEKNVSYYVEDTLTVTAPSQLVSYQSFAKSIDITITGGSGNEITLSDDLEGAIKYKDGKLSMTYPDVITDEAEKKITLTVKSDAGQEKSVNIQLINYSTLAFTSKPAAAGIYAYVG